MSDGSGGWAGKEVKGGQASQIRETCVSCMCCVCVMCVAKGSHTGVEWKGQSRRPHPRLGGNRRVREGGRGAAQRRGTMVTSVLAAAEGLRGELAEVLRGRDVGWRSGGTLPRPGGPEAESRSRCGPAGEREVRGCKVPDGSITVGCS